jgi:hypothetical protein
MSERFQRRNGGAAGWQNAKKGGKENGGKRKGERAEGRKKGARRKIFYMRDCRCKRKERSRMSGRKHMETGGKETGKKGFFRFLALVGLVLVAYFTLNIVINMVYGVDLAGKGAVVVVREPRYQGDQLVDEGESVVLHGVSGWVSAFAPWLAVNANLLALGVILFGIGFTLTAREPEKSAVTLFKLRILAWYLLAVALLMLVLGIDRIYFLPHAETGGVLGWIDWYIFEFLAHVVWATIVAILAIFFLRYAGENGAHSGNVSQEGKRDG